MATIPNFPQRFLDEHLGWHSNMDSMGTREGDGIEFLEFHRQFLKKTIGWYRSNEYNPRRVAPWSTIPMEIKNHPSWSRSLVEAERRITNNLESFESADELGRFIQTSRLHAAIHVIGAEVYDEEDFSLVDLAPRSTLFYNWHGLIDRWYSEIERR